MGRGQPTGWEVAKRACEINAALAVIYLTGDAGGEGAANGAPHSLLGSGSWSERSTSRCAAEFRQTAEPPHPWHGRMAKLDQLGPGCARRNAWGDQY